MKEIKTNDGKKGGWLVGKRHYDKSGKSLGGIKAIVTDAGGKPVELEGGEVIINREASKKYWKELSRINQSAGNGVAIGPPSGFDEDPEDNYENGGKIDFNPNHIPNKWILSYAEKIKANHPEIWKLGGNIFGNEAFKNLKRVADRGHWLDSEEWMYIKWRAYVARHQRDYRIEGVVAMLKWVDKVEKGWPYMKQLIEEKINKIESKKKGWKHKMRNGGNINKKIDINENKNQSRKETIIEEAISYISRGIKTAEKKQPTGIPKNKIKDLESQLAFEFAFQKNIWHEDSKNLPRPIAGGGNENELYYDENTGIIYKSNNLFNSDFSILKYLNYLLLHNKIFSETEYTLFGFSGFSNNYPEIKNAIPYVQPIIMQNYIIGESSTQSEIDNYMKSIGFEKINEHTYTNDAHIISDLRPRNVLTNKNGDVFVIDNIIRVNKKMKTGGRTVSQTPASKEDQIKGSDVNKPGSSATTKSASSIKFDESTIESIKNKVQEHNQKHPDNKITLASAKAVVRRGMGAYSSSHRPTITGGQPNSRVAWGIARLNAFTYKIVHGKSKSGKYTQDDDLINELGYEIAKMKNGGYIDRNKLFFEGVKKSFLKTYPGISIDLVDGQIIFSLFEKELVFDFYTMFKKVDDKIEYEFGKLDSEETGISIDVDKSFNYDKSKIIKYLNNQKFKNGGELTMGIKAEHEHSYTIDKFKRKGVSDLDIETAIAKDHLKEDPHYYSKLAKMEGKKYAGGGLVDAKGQDVNVLDYGYYDGRTKENVTVNKITDKLVYFTNDQGKYKNADRSNFSKYFINKNIQKPTQPIPSTNQEYQIKQVLNDLADYIKQGVGFIDPEYALQSFVSGMQDEGYKVDLPLDEDLQRNIFTFFAIKDLLYTTEDGETKDKKISSDEAFKLMNPKSSQSIDDKIEEAIRKFEATRLVKDLPSGLLSRVYANQIAQGNTQESNLELDKTKRKGNFNWDESPEGEGFWHNIAIGDWTNKDVLSVIGSKEAFFEAPSKPTTIDLTNTKIRINSPEESKLFQEFAFNQGAKWSTGDEFSYTTKPFLYLDRFLNFSYSDTESTFDGIANKEITLEELGLKLSSEATEIGIKQKEIQTHKHQDESEIRSERDLLVDEYNDITFLISITPSTDVDNMLALKQQSKELKDKLDALDLELKKKIDGEVNLLENLFKSSTVKPQERYQFKPYNDGFAPDGQPTELPKNLYDWTMTEEFINWFGNFTTAYNYKNSGYLNTPCSVVVNKNYEPLIVYHGTGSEFSFFKFDKFPAMYFAENVDYSNWFAEIKGREIGTNGYIYPFFLNIRTPLDLTHFKIDDISPQDFIDWMFLQTGLDEDELKINKALLDPNGKYKVWRYMRSSPEMLQVLREKNVCDGVIYYEDNPSVDKTSSAYQTKAYIVFNSNSAKIADPSRDKLTVSAMRSFYLKKGGKV